MKELVVISGKGGTGKTSLVAAFASLAGRTVLADCDVDAADLHLAIRHEIVHREYFKGGLVARINYELCNECGLCQRFCRFEAIGPERAINTFFCEGCGVCADQCPTGAITMEKKVSGEWFLSETGYGPMVHARLGIAEENSGKLVTLVRKKAKDEAETRGIPLIIVDGSPGIGCPVIASIGGCSRVVIVTEPTVSGVHDATRVIELAKHFRVPASLLVNKSDLNQEVSGEIRRFCAQHSIPFLGEIPYDEAFTHALINKRSLIEYADSETTRKIKEIWEILREESVA